MERTFYRVLLPMALLFLSPCSLNIQRISDASAIANARSMISTWEGIEDWVNDINGRALCDDNNDGLIIAEMEVPEVDVSPGTVGPVAALVTG
jgi:hypothetical protein